MRWSYLGAALFTVLAVLGALGYLGLTPVLAVLTLTLVAIIWYTAFAHDTAEQAQQTARLTEQLAAIEASRVRVERVNTLPELREVVRGIQVRLENFLSHEIVREWADGRSLDQRPKGPPVQRSALAKGRPLAALQREEVRQAVVNALARAQDTIPGWRAAENGLSAQQAEEFIVRLRRAKEAVDAAHAAVLKAIQDGG
jgi:hypothetical protein